MYACLSVRQPKESSIVLLALTRRELELTGASSFPLALLSTATRTNRNASDFCTHTHTTTLVHRPLRSISDQFFFWPSANFIQEANTRQALLDKVGEELFISSG